ncbi:MAG: pyridoxamine 5'-phosphate oxidase family protein [Candidatus Nomurabacteria bacterium]|jgi:uncharacterized pyridoxamine 5'-phosphate oxidase family protein|nr:pyridoxamine 5'-phosphate oxidase family protein [Candidatus Nomurabacteria bacterium]
MEEIFEFLKSAEVMTISTVSEEHGVDSRPFGAPVMFDGKIYLITKRTKNVSRELTADNRACITAFDKEKDFQWLRIYCNLIDDSENMACKQLFLQTFDDLEEEGYTLDNPDFQILYLANVQAVAKDYDEQTVFKV